MEMKDLIPQAEQIVKNLLNQQDSPALGMDLDGTITEFPFFGLLSQVWPGRVYVITFRRDYDGARDVVEQFGIRCDEIILVNSMDGKASVISEKQIAIYFDDQPEMLKNIPEGVQVFLARNAGNFDYESQKWMMSNQTGKII